MEEIKIKVSNKYVLLHVHSSGWNKDKCIVKYNNDHLGHTATFEELKKLLKKYKAVDEFWFDNYYRMYWVELKDEDLKEESK